MAYDPKLIGYMLVVNQEMMDKMTKFRPNYCLDIHRKSQYKDGSPKYTVHMKDINRLMVTMQLIARHFTSQQMLDHIEMTGFLNKRSFPFVPRSGHKLSRLIKLANFANNAQHITTISVEALALRPDDEFIAIGILHQNVNRRDLLKFINTSVEENNTSICIDHNNDFLLFTDLNISMIAKLKFNIDIFVTDINDVDVFFLESVKL